MLPCESPVTAYSRTGETGMCVWFLSTTRTAQVPLLMTAAEQKICKSSALGGICALGKGLATHCQREISALKRSCCSQSECSERKSWYAN